MRNLQRFWVHAGQPAMLYAIALALLGSLLFFRLGTLVKPFSAEEFTARESSQSINRIAENPVNAPHKLGQLALQKTGHRGLVAMRSVSVLFGMIAIGLFFVVARVWFTSRIAALGSVLLASSSWFLHSARSATPDIMLLAILALIACGSWIRYSRRRSLAFAIAAAVSVICLYIPGLIWFVVGFMLLQTRVIIKELRRTKWPVIAAFMLLGVLAIMPLVLSIIKDPSLLRILLGLPESLQPWQEMGKNIVNLPLRLFVRMPESPSIWLGTLPLLDVFSSTMFFMGLYGLHFQRKLDRTKLLTAVLLIGSMLISLGGSVSLTIMLPFIYIVIMSGLTLMLQQWFTVFPRNPLARGIGVGLLSGAILLSVFYHGSRYYVAWPQTPETKQAYIYNP